MIFSQSRRLCSILKKHTELHYNQHRKNGFIVLLPEVDPEIADKMISVNDELPTFSQLTTEKLGMLTGKQIVDYECAVRNADRKLEADPSLYPDLFEDVLDPLEKPTVSFDTVWGVLKTLYLANSKLVPAAIYSTLSHRVNIARATRYNTDFIYTECKKCDKSKLTEDQIRVVEKHLLEGRLNCIDSSPRYRSINIFKYSQILQKQCQFRIRVEAARSQFYLILDDPFIIRECPAVLLEMMSNVGNGSCEGPWTVKLHYNIGEKFLEYCPDRNIRFMIWHAEDKAGSLSEERRELANSVCLEEIRHLRYETAKAAGYKNYFEANLGTKMADSIETIEHMLSSYLTVARPAQYDQVVKLQEFADANSFAHPIQMWDLPYWARKYKQSVFHFDDEMLRSFLTLNNVISGLFKLCSRLFGLRIEEVKSIDVWHPDVKFYHVFEQDCDKPSGGFYFDPYRRDTKLKLNADIGELIPIRYSSGIPRRVMPITALILNLTPPTKERPCCLSFSEAEALFAKFGHNLQYLLNKCSYSEVAGLNFVEYDAIEVCSKFMASWMYDKTTFDSMLGHYKTGDKISSVDLTGVKNHLAAYRLCKEMFKAQMDLKMHTLHDKFWMDIADELWDDHLIFPKSKYFSDPCRYLDIFCGVWGAAFYSHIWSDMLVADILQAFREEKDEALVGSRFHDTFLTFGGSCHSREVFRRFRGRDPYVPALLEEYGLTENVSLDTDPETTSENPKLVVTC